MASYAAPELNATDALAQKRPAPANSGGPQDLAGALGGRDEAITRDYNLATGTSGSVAPPIDRQTNSQMLPGSTAGDVKPGPTLAPPQQGTPGAPGSTPNPGQTPDPFAAQGGGVNINGNWFPKDHPGAIEWMKNNPQAAPGAPAPGPATTPPPTEPQPPSNAPTVPPPGAGTPAESTEQFNTALRGLMGTKEVADVKDPVIAAQLDPMRAEAERAMRGEVREGAEAAFAGGQDFGAPETVAARERQGNKVGLAAADLVGRETMANREKILNGLKLYGDRMSQEQRNALEEKLATMDINLKKYLGDKDFELGKGDQDLKRQGLEDARTLGGRELDIKDRLGMGDLNIRSILAQLQNQQFNKRFGLDVGMAEQDANDRAMRAAMGL